MLLHMYAQEYIHQRHVVYTSVLLQAPCYTDDREAKM